MRNLKLAALAIALAQGCITAPVGFYETAFPSNTRFYAGMAGEEGRNYEDIPDDTGKFSYAEPSEIVSLIWLSYSPVPKLSVGLERTNSGDMQGGMRAKLSLLNNNKVAVAAVCRGGLSWGSYGGMVWPVLLSYCEDTTIYRLYNLSAAGILSYSLLGDWKRGVGRFPVRLSLNAGPKALLARLDYTRIKESYYEDTVYSDTCRFLGNIHDYGWFLGANAEISIFTIAWEMTFLSAESPLRRERAWARFWGVSVGGTF
jgi:hypothetical protein